jgi:single-stranded-DNA-specific exonuclease
LDIDCAVPPEMLTLSGIQSLDIMEPCGNGCPKPVLMVENMTVDRLRPVGNGKHLRLRLRRGSYGFNAIFFSATPESASISQGDLVDVAFLPQINEFREELSVQMNVQDIRPACKAECSPELSGYTCLRRGCIDPEQAAALLPDRATLGIIWRYLADIPGGSIREMPMCLCRKIVRWSGTPLSLGKMLTCLDIFSDVGLLTTQRLHNTITIQLTQGAGKADLTQSRTMQMLEQKRVENHGNL